MRWAVIVLLVLFPLSGGAEGAEPAPPHRPALSVLSPADGATVSGDQVIVNLKVRAKPGTTLSLSSEVDGDASEKSRGLNRVEIEPGPGDEQETTRGVLVIIPHRDCTVRIIARTPWAASEPVLLRLRWRPEQAPAAENKPRLYVLSVGVSSYEKADLKLRYPSKDAGDLASALTEQAGKRYRAVEARVLADREATLGRIQEGLLWLEQKTTADDVAVVFLAGHGVNDGATRDYFYLPYDANLDNARATMLSGQVLQKALRRIPGKVLLFLDTCHSGNVMAKGVDVLPFAAQLAGEDNGAVVFTSSTGKQISRESREWGNGAFTKALVEGLRGRADHNKTGRVTVAMLDLYVSERVRELTRETQTPATAKSGTLPDFVVSQMEAQVDVEIRHGKLPATPRQRALRAGGAALAVAGAMGVIAGAVLMAVHGRQGCDLQGTQLECPQLLNTQGAGIGILAAGVLGLGGAGLLVGLSYRGEGGAKQAALSVGGRF